MREIKFALIYENEVKNVFLCENYELANVLARASFGDMAFAIETTKYASSIGNKYENGIFYNKLEDGTFKEVECIPSLEEKILVLQSKIIQTQLVIAETYESKITLEDKILTLQQIITDLYEKMEEKK